MFYNEKSYVYLDGKFVKATEAHASFYSQTLNYGAGVIEGIRAYKTPEGTRIFKADKHFERMRYSADKLGLSIEINPKRLEEITYELLEKNDLENAYIRPIIYASDEMKPVTTANAHLFIAVFKWARYLGQDPVRACISDYCRPSPKAFPVEAKISGLYANAVLASSMARKKGFQEAILTDVEGNLAQAPTMNIFIQKDGELFTPKRGFIMPGITRQTIIEIAQQEGIKVNETTLTVDDLKNADSAFFTGTGSGIVGIEAVEEKEFMINERELIYPKLAEFYNDRLRSSYGENYTII